jgi:hypothetical protein
VSFLIWMTIDLILPFELDLAALLEPHPTTILQAYQVLLKNHLIFCSLNYILSTKNLNKNLISPWIIFSFLFNLFSFFFSFLQNKNYSTVTKKILLQHRLMNLWRTEVDDATCTYKMTSQVMIVRSTIV